MAAFYDYCICMSSFVGIEVLNDDVTPVEQVMRWLTLALNLSERIAFERAFTIHQRGSLVVGLNPAQDLPEESARLERLAKEHAPTLKFRFTDPLSDSAANRYTHELETLDIDVDWRIRVLVLVCLAVVAGLIAWAVRSYL